MADVPEDLRRVMSGEPVPGMDRLAAELEAAWMTARMKCGRPRVIKEADRDFLNSVEQIIQYSRDRPGCIQGNRLSDFSRIEQQLQEDQRNLDVERAKRQKTVDRVKRRAEPHHQAGKLIEGLTEDLDSQIERYSRTIEAWRLMMAANGKGEASGNASGDAASNIKSQCEGES